MLPLASRMITKSPTKLHGSGGDGCCGDGGGGEGGGGEGEADGGGGEGEVEGGGGNTGGAGGGGEGRKGSFAVSQLKPSLVVVS